MTSVIRLNHRINFKGSRRTIVKKGLLIGGFSCLAFLVVGYVVIVFHPSFSKQIFGWNSYQSGFYRDKILFYLPDMYRFISVIFVGSCLLFGRIKKIQEKRYWIVGALIFPLVLTSIGFLAGYVSFTPSLFQQDTVTSAFNRLIQQQDIQEEKLIITGLSFHVENVPRQQPITLTATIRNLDTKQDDRYQLMTKTPFNYWKQLPSVQSDTLSGDLKINDLRLEKLPTIIKDVSERQKLLENYHSGICLVELDTRNKYWRIGIQNVSGVVDYTYIYSVDGEYIIRLAS